MQPKRNNELIAKLKQQMQDENISPEMKQSINELIFEYEAVTFAEWEEKGDFFAKSLCGIVSDCGFDEKGLAEKMAREHNTIQQSYMRLFKAFVLKMAEKNRCDLRNKGAVELAKSIEEQVKNAYLPFI